ncbi:MAG: hypothetical protein GX456_04940, partial [Verrucomicrobia bacterium]|nr:hypothetical protein [Verrucomicrobiota bacterium]
GKSVARSLTGWGRARMPALLHALEKATALGSAAVLGRINVTTDPTTRLDHANAASEHSPAEMRKLCVCPHICIRGVPPQTSATADRNKGQFAGRAPIRGQNPNCEPVTLSSWLPKIALLGPPY